MGREHFYNVLQSRNQAGNYPQLVLDKEIGSWKTGDEFQWGFYSDEQSVLCRGKVLENDGKEIRFEADEKTNIVSQKIETLKKYVGHGLLWKLVPGA